MSSTPSDDDQQHPGPSRRDVLRPVELVGGSALAAVFVGVIVLMTTREWQLTAISAGIVFIVVLVVLAMFALTFKDDEAIDPRDESPDPGEEPPGH
ncbi:ABC transporter ATP-binding protein [Agromyces sp. SYSU T00194]|uniref:ABC transporter ATP-binding protein n=1 Tax=Agromyces chitinivorans TaxID=3158560 RepID=UPI0033910CAA